MRVSILEHNYSSKRMYEPKNYISEWAINKHIETLEQNGYRVVNVQVNIYEQEEKERVIIIYDKAV